MNRLARERSPYLLQHAGNPVDWYPWGEEAFEKARREERPIFLSVGYSTCHWCHVMEHESFEDEAIARLLNEAFVPIKVDREERPDVDRVYMAFVQSTTGSGGWPMSVFLTPALKPFYGGTYFPPHSRWGRPGFADLLQEIARVWREDRSRVEYAAAELLDRLRAVAGADGQERVESTIAGPEALDEAVEQFQMAFDRHHGGFGDAPKFPRPSEILFLLREHARRRGASSAPRLMATETLRAMALGGMHDHVGGGFHRYSVDAAWRVPHFEKMLYDQAQLALAYLDAAQATGETFYAAVAEDTFAYVLRDLADPGGAFYSAEDADSRPLDADPSAPGREGAFYVWTAGEIDRVLGADAGIAKLRFGIEAGGNAPADPQGEFAGQNILYTAMPIEAIAARTGRSEEAVADALGRIRHALFEARASRPRPHLDDKVLTSWNGLMIAALARAARVLVDQPTAARYLEAAQRAAAFLRKTMWRPDATAPERLLRRFRDGDAAIPAFAEDYAFLVWGLVELFQADGDAAWLEWALELQRAQDALFWDEREGGWFSTTGHDPSVLLRLKEDYDGAEPAASSVAALNLIALAHLTGNEDARAKAGRTLGRYGPRLGRAARAVPMMLCALSAWHTPPSQIVLVSTADGRDALARALARHYLPASLIIPVREGEAQRRLAAVMPEVGAMRAVDGQPTAYVCQHFACSAPATSADALDAQLQQS